MLVIRACAAFLLALGLLSIAAPARACDERVTPGCDAAPGVASETESDTSNLVRRVPMREPRQARQSRSEKHSRKAEKAESRARSASASRRKAPIVEDDNTGEDLPAAKSTMQPKAPPRVAEILTTESAEPAFSIEIEAPSLSGARFAAASVPSLDRDLAAEPQVAPRLSLEAKAKASAVAEVSPTGAAERRSAAMQLALKQEAERFVQTQEQVRATEAATMPADSPLQLNALRTAFLAFGGLLLLGTAARLVIG